MSTPKTLTFSDEPSVAVSEYMLPHVGLWYNLILVQQLLLISQNVIHIHLQKNLITFIGDHLSNEAVE